jgi:hypothetical protein
MRKLKANPEADTECDACGDRFPLYDELERVFEDEQGRRQAEAVAKRDAHRREKRRLAKLLALEVAARIASADQSSRELPHPLPTAAADREATEAVRREEAIDLLLEFTDDQGEVSGHSLYLSLHILERPRSRNDPDRNGKEESPPTLSFPIPSLRWVEACLAQPRPVMLVMGMLPAAAEDGRRGDRPGGGQTFSDVRWMEISSWLRSRRNRGQPLLDSPCWRSPSQANGWI